MKFRIESVMNDAASVALAVLSFLNSCFDGILIPMIDTASAAIIPEAKSIRSQYNFPFRSPSCVLQIYGFSQKQRISGLCFIKNSDYKEPETYLR